MEKIFLKDKGLFVLKYRSIRSWGRATVKIIWKGTFPGPLFHPKYKATPHRTCKLSNLWSVLTKAQEQQTEVAQLFPPFIGVSSPNSCLWPSCMDFTAPCTSPSDTPPHSFKLTLDHYLLPSQPPSHSSSASPSGVTWAPEAHILFPLHHNLETISLSLGSLIWKDNANEWTVAVSLLLLT